MIPVYLRTRPDERQPRAGLLLDWFGIPRSANVTGSVDALTHQLATPAAEAVELLRWAVAVYCADKLVLRSDQDDRWTRSFRIHVPVSDPKRWNKAAPVLLEALSFLTNDVWRVRFRAARNEQTVIQEPLLGMDVACLFSGGLDSLAGAIDLLEEGHSVALVGHYDSNLLRPRQQRLYESLASAYGHDRVLFRPFFLRPASPREEQARPLGNEREPTTRSRSVLFMGAAVVVASAVGTKSVVVPENGFIGLNIPLEVSRLGACSTRTTHPFFLSRFREGLTRAQVDVTIENPYDLRTKAEVLDACRNRELLLRLAPHTISCAHPELGRWTEESYGNCGYCYPCLMRRVALHRVGADDPSLYRVDVGNRRFLRDGGGATNHLRALVGSTSGDAQRTDVLRSGPLPSGCARGYGDLYERGRAEIRVWLDAAITT